MKKRIKLVQSILKKRNAYNDDVDGLMGPNTRQALSTLEEKGVNAQWPANRQVIAAIQVLAIERGFEAKPIDGRWGPITEEAFNQLLLSEKDGQSPTVAFVRPEDIEVNNPNNWPEQYSEAFKEFYGEPGENLTKITLPYTHKLSWEPYARINRFSCHRRVAESMEKVLVNVLDSYGLDEIIRLRLDKWGGCFNIRKIRGGRKMSMHSWGIAVDFDPARNKLKWGGDKAAFAKREYDKWWKCWEDEGWMSLGRQRNFDWMHVQASTLKS